MSRVRVTGVAAVNNAAGKLRSSRSVQVLGKRIDKYPDLGGQAAMAGVKRVHVNGVVLVIRQ
jgi:hypothetical protein